MPRASKATAPPHALGAFASVAAQLGARARLGLSPACLAAILLSSGAASAQPAKPREVYLSELSEEAPQLARALRAFRGEGKADAARAPALRVLLDGARDPRRTNSTLPEKGLPNASVKVSVGFASRVRDVLVKLAPGERAAIAKLQEEEARLALASQEPPSLRALIERYPLSRAARDAGRKLNARAIEAADPAGAVELRRWLSAAHPDLEFTSSPRFVPANLSKPKPKPPARKGSSPPHLRLRIQHALVPGGRLGTGFAPCLPTLVGERVVVSDGARVHLYSLQGAPQGSLPVVAGSNNQGPDPTQGFLSRVSARGSIGFAPLLFDGALASGRVGRARDDSFAGRFFSLLAFDVNSAKVVWWDGDPGPSGAGAPGFGSDPKLRDFLRRAHVLACATGPRRVYVAFTVPGRDSELWAMAFERSTGLQPFVLRPAWSAPVYLFTLQRRRGDASETLIAPEISAALRFDPQRGLFATTDAGVVASLEPARGKLRWLAECKPGRFRQSGAPAPLPHLQGDDLLTLHDGIIYRLNAETGRSIRALPCGSASRLLSSKTPSSPKAAWLMAYGPRRGFLFEPKTDTRAGELRLDPGERCVGEAAWTGELLAVPVLRRRRGAVVLYRRFPGGWQRLSTLKLERVAYAFNLTATPRGFVGASARNVVFLEPATETRAPSPPK